MSPVSRLLAHFGYIKLRHYGYMLTDDGRIVSIARATDLLQETSDWSLESRPVTRPVASLAPGVAFVLPLAGPAQVAALPLAPPAPLGVRPPSPRNPRPTSLPKIVVIDEAAAEPDAEGLDEEEEWEWRMAMARAAERVAADEAARAMAPEVATATAGAGHIVLVSMPATEPATAAAVAPKTAPLIALEDEPPTAAGWRTRAAAAREAEIRTAVGEIGPRTARAADTRAVSEIGETTVVLAADVGDEADEPLTTVSGEIGDTTAVLHDAAERARATVAEFTAITAIAPAQTAPASAPATPVRSATEPGVAPAPALHVVRRAEPVRPSVEPARPPAEPARLSVVDRAASRRPTPTSPPLPTIRAAASTLTRKSVLPPRERRASDPPAATGLQAYPPAGELRAKVRT